MATTIFILSTLSYIVLLTLRTNIVWLPLWLAVSYGLGIITVVISYFLQLPIVLKLEAKHPYKTYLMRSLSAFLNRFVFRLTVVVEGMEHIPAVGPLVVYANHKSYTDAFAVIEFFPRALTYAPKKSIFKIPLLGLWLKAYDVFPINRDNHRDTAIALEKAVETVKNDHAIIFFPEGTIRNRLKHKVESMRPGAFKLALRASATILIIKLVGNDLVRHRAPFKKSVRHLTILPPITYDQYKDLTTQDVANLVMDKINQTKVDFKEDPA